MDEWVRDGSLVDLILVATVLEGVVLWAYHRRTGRGIPLPQYGFNLLSGLCLLAALREALAGSWIGICAGLSLALVAHVSDLARRWTA